MARFRKSSATVTSHVWKGQHRFEHWYRDNTIYLITSKARDGRHVFQSDRAKEVFWDRFTYWTSKYDFCPYVTSLLSNHYHVIGYLPVGENPGPLMQKFHGSVAKLVNDTLDERHLPFWRFAGNQDYYDGCLRNPKQVRNTYRYVLNQGVRAGLARRPEDYAHTHVNASLEEVLAFGAEKNVYLDDVPYARYDGYGAQGPGSRKIASRGS